MENLRLEKVPIQIYGLGLLGFDHLHIVWERNQTSRDQARWYVLEGLRDGSGGGPFLGVEGIDGATTLSESNGGARDLDLVKKIGTPETRGSVIIPTTGAISSIWNNMASFGADIDGQKLPYIGYAVPNGSSPTLNSSSVVASLLFHAGIDITQNLPIGLGTSPGTNTLIGSSQNDTLSIVSGFNALVGGYGKDTFYGSDRENTIEKFSGGYGDDTFKWSKGINIFHGGQARLDYKADGSDTVDYIGVGVLTIDAVPFAFPHFAPDYIATHDGAIDQLYSIEGILYSRDSDTIIAGPNVHLLSHDLILKLDKESSDGKGDSITFASSEAGLTINNANEDNYFVQSASNDSGNTAGLWLESAEWLEGSSGNDKIYGGELVRGLEGGTGDDIIDARSVKAFSKDSSKFDVEIFGGGGADTLVSGAGRSIATGGADADRFVLSTLTNGAQSVEFVVADAESADRLFVPHEFFTQTHKGFDGSALMPILGAFTQYSGQSSFNDLPENLGPWATGPLVRSDIAIFTWQTQEQNWNNNDQTQGVFEFTGAIFFNREGSDLLIHLFSGTPDVVTELGYADLDWTHTLVHIDIASETIIRVKSFEDGDLGIHFYDRGEREAHDLEPLGARPLGAVSYSKWDTGVFAMTAGGALTPALELRPQAPAYDPGKSDQNELPALIVRGNTNDTVTITSGTADVQSGGGNDTITTVSGNDHIDGGTGADTMQGGRGNDSYVVDNVGDRVIEAAGGGLDFVTSSVSYTLTENVERLELSGTALEATGNRLDNHIAGNELNNVLIGLEGSDVLFGSQGDDTLNGGGSGDTYVYNASDGHDIIIDEGRAADIDVLILSGVTAEDVSFHIDMGSPLDLVMSFSSGGRIVLQGFMAGNGRSIERVVFDDGLKWTRDQLEGFATVAPMLSNDAPQAHDDLDYSVRSGTTLISSLALTQNDTDFEGDTLTIKSVSTATPGLSVVLDKAGNVIAGTSAGYEGLVEFSYTISDGHSESSATVQLTVIKNASPIAAGTIAGQTAQAGQSFSFTVPDGLFSDPDQDALTLLAHVAGGASLPAWLHFNSETRTFSGTPLFGQATSLDIVVTATDGSASADIGFSLAIEGAAVGTLIVGTNHNDVLSGTSGIDIIDGRAGNDIMRGYGGDDRFIVEGKNSGFDIFIGGAGTDQITGSSGDDTIGLARSAANLSGIEIIDGGDGFDSVRLAPHSGDSTVNFSNIQLIGIELIYAGSGSDRVTGSAGDDHIFGGRGDDVLRGGAGNDTFLFHGRYGGLDTISGGSGFDRIAGGSGNDVIGLARGLTARFGIEAIDGGGGRDILQLSNHRDVLNLSKISVTGIELISAGGGNDTLAGSAGNDRIRGGAGDDVFIFRGNFGHDAITDFHAGSGRFQHHDVIDLRGAGYTTISEVFADASESAAGTLISVGSQGSILLEGVRLSHLKAYDFLL